MTVSQQSREPEANKVTWWIIGSMLSIVLLVGANGVQQAQAKISETAAAISSTNQRVSSLEAQQRSIDARLSAMDLKLDKIIDNQIERGTR